MSTRNPVSLVIRDKYAFEWRGTPDDLPLFACLGAALAEVQALEFALVCHITDLLQKGATGVLSNVALRDDLFEKTLGVLSHKFQNVLLDKGEQLKELLSQVVEKRNYLVHRFLRAYQWPMMSAEDYVRAIQEAESIRSFLEKANLDIAKYLGDKELLKLIIVHLDHELGSAEHQNY